MEDKSGKYEQLVQQREQYIKDEINRYRDSISNKYKSEYLTIKLAEKIKELENAESVYFASLSGLMKLNKGSHKYYIHGPDMWFDSTYENMQRRREALTDFTYIARLNGIKVTYHEYKHQYADCMEGNITVTICDINIQ